MLTQSGGLLDKVRALQTNLRRLIEVVPQALAPERPAPRGEGGRSSFVAATHTFEGATRRFKLFTPSKPARSPWLVVMLHGCTQEVDDFAAGTRMNEAAERDGFFVAWPQQSRDANPSTCWNWFGAREQNGGGEAALLADLTKSLVASHGIDPRRVYVAGLSAGGAMAAILAAQNPTLFAAVAVHSGLPAGAAGNMPDALMAMRNGPRRHGVSTVPTIVLHGDHDRTVHPDNGAALIAAVVGDATHAQRTEEGASYTRTEHLDADGRTRAEHWVLHGAGHAWAGGDAQGSYTDPGGIDATANILRFFGEHPG